MVVNPNKLIVIIHDLSRCLVNIKNIDIQSIQTTGICDECKKLLLTLTFAIFVKIVSTTWKSIKEKTCNEV